MSAHSKVSTFFKLPRSAYYKMYTISNKCIHFVKLSICSIATILWQTYTEKYSEAQREDRLPCVLWQRQANVNRFSRLHAEF
jgi:hypothetical protein